MVSDLLLTEVPICFSTTSFRTVEFVTSIQDFTNKAYHQTQMNPIPNFRISIEAYLQYTEAISNVKNLFV